MSVYPGMAYITLRGDSVLQKHVRKKTSNPFRVRLFDSGDPGLNLRDRDEMIKQAESEACLFSMLGFVTHRPMLAHTGTHANFSTMSLNGIGQRTDPHVNRHYIADTSWLNGLIFRSAKL